jgi:hypothetical protein
MDVVLDKKVEAELREESKTYRWALALMNPENLIGDKCEDAERIIFEQLKQEKLEEQRKLAAEKLGPDPDVNNNNINNNNDDNKMMDEDDGDEQNVVAVDSEIKEDAEINEVDKKSQVDENCLPNDPTELAATIAKMEAQLMLATQQVNNNNSPKKSIDDVKVIEANNSNNNYNHRASELLEKARSESNSRSSSRRQSNASNVSRSGHQSLSNLPTLPHKNLPDSSHKSRSQHRSSRPARLNTRRKRSIHSEDEENEDERQDEDYDRVAIDDDPLAFNVRAYQIKMGGSGGGNGSRKKAPSAPPTPKPKPEENTDSSAKLPKHPAHRMDAAASAKHTDLRQERVLKDIKKNCLKLCNSLNKELKDEIADDASKQDWIFLQDDLEEEKKQKDALEAYKEGGTWLSWIVEKGVDYYHPIGLEAENWTEKFEQGWEKKYEPHVERLYYQSNIPFLRDIPPGFSFVNTYAKEFRNNHLEVVKRKAMEKNNQTDTNKTKDDNNEAETKHRPAAKATEPTATSVAGRKYKRPPPDKSDKEAYTHWYWSEHDPEWYYGELAKAKAKREQQQKQQQEQTVDNSYIPPRPNLDTLKEEKELPEEVKQTAPIEETKPTIAEIITNPNVLPAPATELNTKVNAKSEREAKKAYYEQLKAAAKANAKLPK